jgi:hypothetical protein
VRRRKTLAAACVATLAIASPAHAGTPTHSKVTFNQSNVNPAKFKGKVKSSEDECVVGRKVLILRVEGSDAQKVAKTFATESGRYSVKIPMQSGNELFARIKQVFASPHNCLGDDSDTITA